ncbi:unnamed protein product, partial [Callosobruchus maculatus]
MQSEILAVEDAMKIEVDAVKTEPVEAEGELIGIEQTRRPKVKHGNTDESVLTRIKKEQVDNDWDWENELKMQDTKNELKMQDTKVKLEEDVNCEELKIEAEEVIIKEENDDFKDANGGIAVKR